MADQLRPAKEVAEQLRLLKLQRRGIPAHSFFGDDNHGPLDKAIKAFETAKTHKEASALRDRALDAEKYDEFFVAALDWLMMDTEELPVEPDDNWVKKALERGAKA